MRILVNALSLTTLAATHGAQFRSTLQCSYLEAKGDLCQLDCGPACAEADLSRHDKADLIVELRSPRSESSLRQSHSFEPQTALTAELHRSGPVPSSPAHVHPTETYHPVSDGGDVQLGQAVDFALKKLFKNPKAQSIWDFLWKPFIRTVETPNHSFWKDIPDVVHSLPGPFGHSAASRAVAPFQLPIGRKEMECYWNDTNGLEPQSLMPVGKMRQILDSCKLRAACPWTDVPFIFRIPCQGFNSTCPSLCWGFLVELMNVVTPLIPLAFIPQNLCGLADSPLSLEAIQIPDLAPPTEYIATALADLSSDTRHNCSAESCASALAKYYEPGDSDVQCGTAQDPKTRLEVKEQYDEMATLASAVQVDYVLQTMYKGHADLLLGVVSSTVGLAADSCPIYVSRFGTLFAAPHITNTTLLNIIDKAHFGGEDVDDESSNHLTPGNWSSIVEALSPWNDENLSIGQLTFGTDESQLFGKANLVDFLRTRALLGALCHGIIDAALVPSHAEAQAIMLCPVCQVVASGVPLTHPAELVLALRSHPAPHLDGME